MGDGSESMYGDSLPPASIKWPAPHCQQLPETYRNQNLRRRMVERLERAGRKRFNDTVA
jgi:hypothetical protein